MVNTSSPGGKNQAACKQLEKLLLVLSLSISYLNYERNSLLTLKFPTLENKQAHT